jgi:hypothetical protein
MNRRLLIATMFLVLALLCLVLVGMSSAGPVQLAGALPQPSPAAAPLAAGADQAAASVVAVGLMSGEFAGRHLA